MSFKINCVIFFCFFFTTSQAQLQANFTVDKQAGCSPLNVKFTNATTGASAGTTWAWNFGNGNSSILKDAGASYFTEKTYTVTLTAKDGATTSTKSMDITVYKKPTLDFSVSPVKGCVPLTATFTATATPGDGTISNYLWDFGDGQSVTGSNYATTSHVYTFPQKPPVTLNVTNTFGCYNTITKNNLVEAVKGVVAAFTPSALTLCNVGESISFTNTSTGSGVLDYKWDFGDGKTSTELSPAHIYTTKGKFIATLTVKSSDGCSATLKSEDINVANFTAGFTAPPKLCLNQYATFTNTSTKPYTRAEWFVDNSLYGYSDYYGDFSTSFSQTGEHTVKLVVYYGNCSVETIQKVIVNQVPALTDFIVELQGACGVPVTINFKDTSKDATAWEWKGNYGNNVFATTQNASNTYTGGSYDYVTLTVKNAAGCASSITKYVNYEKPNVSIYLTNSGNYENCTGIKLSFAATPDTSVKDYKWNFGDGTALSTEANPTHAFNKAGTFNVTLEYTTNNGCKGTASYPYITVVDKPNFDFAVQGSTTICGNTPTIFTATPAVSGWSYYWSFNEYYYNYTGTPTISYQFAYDTTYTVQMIAVNGGCRDTVIKSNYLKVLPPFPHIVQAINTCDNTRGAVRFTEDSKKALQWSWNFGDGSAVDNYTAFKDTIRHTFTKTGTYNVVMSTTNGVCTVKDSVKTYVLLKQQPILTAQKTATCGSDVVNFKLAGYEANPYPFYVYYYAYGIAKIEYGDLTEAANTNLSGNNYFERELNSTLQNLQAGKTDIRMITVSQGFGCLDTSNFIPIRIHGPNAGFKILPHDGCFKTPVYFTDTSTKTSNVAIVKWEWDFGDGSTQTLTTSGSTSHRYGAPGYYYVMLKVTDADGCSNQTNYYLHSISVDGPKADFTASFYNVPPNTLVYLYNNSSYYNSYYYSTLQWILPDSTTSTLENPSFNFTAEGVYTVKLITKNTVTGCTDTASKTITVRKVNSAFTYKLSYINNNSCPPVIATFTSISINASRLSWDFGDGGIGGDQTIVSHTYNKPGVYRVVHYGYDSNNAVDSTEDFIEVKGPYALLKADTLYACNSLQVRLTAEVRNATDYTWDFGDGTVVPTTDTFAVHNYLTPGIYVPALILKDGGGCSATSELPDKVVIDSLAISFTATPSAICDSALSSYLPNVISLSNDRLQSGLNYTWVTKEGAVSDSNYNILAGHFFNTTGTHTVSLEVTSPYGCKQTSINTVTVKQGVNATIAGANKLCQGESTAFTATATPANVTLQWNWDFANGNSATTPSPVAQTYTAAGPKQLSLIVSNGSCADTAYHDLLVNVHPTVNFSPATPFVCKGSNTAITASGGIVYKWSSGAPLVDADKATATVNPVSGSFYFVKVTDATGCSTLDSVFVKVVAPVAITVPANVFACEGTSVQLNASGADRYQWISNTTGLSAVNIPNPTAITASTTTYTVVGYDDYNCFTDTVNLPVRISKLPVVNAGADKELIAGTATTISGTVTGPANSSWSPADYLSCTNCLFAVSTPKSSITYTLTAVNMDGCSASDAVHLGLICKSNLVFIPTAFSPNNDNLNDRFNINGSGIKVIRSVIIYSRWGKPLFERKNIAINDRNNSWDGTYNDEPMPVGAYVYKITAECEGGDLFNYSGTVMILR